MDILRPMFICIVALSALCFSSCVSTDPGADSDIPWNTPQEWEGRPGIPGLDQY